MIPKVRSVFLGVARQVTAYEVGQGVQFAVRLTNLIIVALDEDGIWSDKYALEPRSSWHRDPRRYMTEIDY